jgi:flavin reductase (DIM6/NTAB) family NADH-FMN oxidoreductase RutF
MEVFWMHNSGMTNYGKKQQDLSADHDHDQTRHDVHIDITPGMLYYGNTVTLLSTLNADGSTNLAPMSSTWALGDTIVLGMGNGSKTAQNLCERADAVLNLPGPELWQQVERLGDMTGISNPRAQHGHGSISIQDKFAAVGLNPEPAALVDCMMVAQARLQIELQVVSCDLDASGEFVIAQAHVLRVHADPRIVVPGTSYVDPRKWKPLIYNFRHYHTLAAQIGESGITQTPTTV